MVLFSGTTDKKRILRQKVDERSFTTQYRVRVVRWHRNHASCRMQVPSKPHVCSELRDGEACDDAGHVRMDMEKSSKTHGLNLDEFAI